MPNDDTSIQAGAVIQGIADLITGATPDSKRAVLMAESVLCFVVAHCIKPAGVSAYLGQIGESMEPTIRRIRDCYDQAETEH